jgi:hypothetical protein
VDHIIVSAQIRSLDDGVADMSLDDYRQSLTAAHPTAQLPLALAGLWWDAKGDGTKGSRIGSAGLGPQGFRGCAPICIGRKTIGATQPTSTVGRRSLVAESHRMRNGIVAKSYY